VSEHDLYVECDVTVIGGGLGGVAAALAVVEAGATVVLSEATERLGGQMTSQGVSALDEHQPAARAPRRWRSNPRVGLYDSTERVPEKIPRRVADDAHPLRREPQN